MKTIDEQKAYAVSRIEIFLGKLKDATNPFDIEAQVYTIMRTAESAHAKMHKTNSDGAPHFCEHATGMVRS